MAPIDSRPPTEYPVRICECCGMLFQPRKIEQLRCTACKPFKPVPTGPESSKQWEKILERMGGALTLDRAGLRRVVMVAARGQDPEKAVINIGLKQGAIIRRAKESDGAVYSAIYVGDFMAWKHPRAQEIQMIIDWQSGGFRLYTPENIRRYRHAERRD